MGEASGNTLAQKKDRLNFELEWVYGYDKVARKINKELKQMFEERAKETDLIIKLYAKINGEVIELKEAPELITVAIKQFKEDNNNES
jgi:hypothetical protein